MATRYVLAIVDMAVIEADPAALAAFESAVIARRTGDAEQCTAVEDEVSRESGDPIGEELVIRAARRFINSPQLLHANYEPNGTIWQYHQRRTGIQHADALVKGLAWLREQPDKANAPARPSATTLERGGEA